MAAANLKESTKATSVNHVEKRKTDQFRVTKPALGQKTQQSYIGVATTLTTIAIQYHKKSELILTPPTIKVPGQDAPGNHEAANLAAQPQIEIEIAQQPESKDIDATESDAQPQIKLKPQSETQHVKSANFGAQPQIEIVIEQQPAVQHTKSTESNSQHHEQAEPTISELNFAERYALALQYVTEHARRTIPTEEDVEMLELMRMKLWGRAGIAHLLRL